MLIAICDDEKVFREELKSLLFAYKAEHRLHIDVYEYPTGEALLNSRKAFDMIFLDYLMPGLNGMAVAREFRRRNITCSIVFVTAYSQFMQEAFEVQAYRFYTKPLYQEQVFALMNTFIRNLKLLAPIIVVNDNEQKVVNAKDVLYLEADGKYCIIRTVQNTYRSSKTLAQVHALLPQHCFYRSHKSYVVNLYSIDSYTKNVITLTNGENALIGRSKLADFKRTYCQFIKDYYIKV